MVEAAWPDKAVDVHWAGKTIPGQIERDHYRPKPGPDLALLRVEQADHPCVFLDESFTLDDKLLSYGYSAEYTDGDKVSAECEDWTRDPDSGSSQPLLKFKGGQIWPGLSGGPLLNRRTGGVCGVVRLTRDRALDLGGRAIPTALVLARYDFLIGLQKAFHSRDRTWINLLGAEQKSADRNRIAMLKKVRNDLDHWLPRAVAVPGDARSSSA